MDPNNSSTPNQNSAPKSIAPESSNEPIPSMPVDVAQISPAAQPINNNSSGADGISAAGTGNVPPANKENAPTETMLSLNKPEKNKTTLIALVFIFLLVLCVALGILVFQLMSRGEFSDNSSSPGGTTTVDSADKPNDDLDSPGSPSNSSDISGDDSLNSLPTLELAKSICEKYEGELETTNGSGFYVSVPELYYCMGKEENYRMLSNGSQFSIAFIEDSEKEGTWSEIRSIIRNNNGHEDVSGYVILEDSDTFIKAYATIAGLVREYLVAYGNTVATVAASSDHVIEEILTELGFPDGKRADDYK